MDNSSVDKAAVLTHITRNNAVTPPLMVVTSTPLVIRVIAGSTAMVAVHTGNTSGEATCHAGARTFC